MPIEIIRFDSQRAQRIEQYASTGASSVALASGSGENHAYAVHFIEGGSIGPHPAGFDQLFLVVQGAGWVAGEDGVRESVLASQGAFIRRGTIHSKGSEAGMLAVMLQASHFTLAAGQGN